MSWDQKLLRQKKSNYDNNIYLYKTNDIQAITDQCPPSPQAVYLPAWPKAHHFQGRGVGVMPNDKEYLFSQFRLAAFVLQSSNDLCPLSPSHWQDRRSWETEATLTAYRTAGQQLKLQCVTNIVFLLRSKHSIMPDTMKRKLSQLKLRQKHMQGRDLISQSTSMSLLMVCFCGVTEQGQNSGEKRQLLIWWGCKDSV